MTNDDNPYPDFEGAWIFENITLNKEENKSGQGTNAVGTSRGSREHGHTRDAEGRDERRQPTLVEPEHHDTQQRAPESCTGSSAGWSSNS